jgi:gluconate kinase
LLVSSEVKLVYLQADRELVGRRLAGRQHHYMNPTLIDSQFASLEQPDDALTVDAGLPTLQIVDHIRRAVAV